MIVDLLFYSPKDKFNGSALNYLYIYAEIKMISRSNFH